MDNRFSPRAATCALLASTCLAAPAFAAPERFQTMDANGVDLVTDAYVEPFTEGSAGSGKGAVSIIRNSNGPDQWGGLIYQATVNGITTMVVQLGAISDTFTLSGSAWVPTKANGGSLVPSTYGWQYNAPDGTSIIYDTIIATTGHGGLTTPYQVAGPQCTNVGADPNTCGIPMTITRPDGLVSTLNWDFAKKCNPVNSVPCQNATAYYRSNGVNSAAGYGFTRSYKTDSPGAFTAPVSDWYVRTGASFGGNTTDFSVTYAYPSSGIEQFTDGAGRIWTFTSAADGSYHVRRPGSIVDNIIVTYSSSGTVASVTKDGVTTNYSQSVSGTTGTITITDLLAHTKTVVSDLNLGRVTSIIDQLGHTTSYAYDTSGRLTKVTQPEGNYTQYAYDSRGNLTSTTQVAKSGSGLANIVTSASYDATCSNPAKCNEPNSTTDAKGGVTTYAYDPTNGAVTSITRPAPNTGAVQPQTRYAYTQVTSAGGTPIYMLTGVSECQTLSSCAGAADETKVTAAYNSNLLPTSITLQDGTGALVSTSTMTYTDIGELNTVDGPLSGAGDTTKYRYDAVRELIGVTSPDSDGAGPMLPRAARLTYGGDGQVSKQELGTVIDQSDAAWANFTPLQTTDVAFDANSRPVQRKLSSGATAYALTQTDYDSLGRVNCAATRLNTAVYASLPASACTLSTQGSAGPDQITQNVYDNSGEITDVKVGVGTSDAATERHLTYSNNGKVTSLLDGENNLTTYVYDGFDRLSQTQYPSPTKGSGTSNSADYQQLIYDANSNVTQRRVRSGALIGYSYDNLNRMTHKGGPLADRDYTYDNLGRMLTAKFSTGGVGVTNTYDALSRLTSSSNSVTGTAQTVTSVYDLAGNRTSLTYPTATGAANLTIAYTYLATGEVSTIKDGATSLATYSYDNLGNRTSVTLGNGVVQSYAYDPVSRLTTLTNDLAGTGNDLTIGGSTSPITYNAAGQILSAARSNDVYAWTGSANVNRGYISNGLNQYTAAATATFTYDTNGNLTSDGSNTFGYDIENELTSAVEGGVTTNLSYDPLMRLYQVAGSTTSRFAYDGVNILADYDGSNNLQHRYVFGPRMDEPLVEYTAAGVRTYLSSDDRGSIVARSDSTGALVKANIYDEYGIPGSTNGGLFQYTGQAWIGQLGMYDYKARVYSPTLGRFMQTDPIGPYDSPNLYEYVRSDPINAHDPTGKLIVLYAHELPGGFYHMFLGIYPNDPSAFSDDGEFTVNSTGDLYTTIGAGPNADFGSGAAFGYLTERALRTHDVEDPAIMLAYIVPSVGQSENDLINALLNNAGFYCNCAYYSLFPAFMGHYNSNSFISGLLNSVGIDINTIKNFWGYEGVNMNELTFPGIDEALPSSCFGGESWSFTDDFGLDVRPC